MIDVVENLRSKVVGAPADGFIQLSTNVISFAHYDVNGQKRSLNSGNIKANISL